MVRCHRSKSPDDRQMVARHAREGEPAPSSGGEAERTAVVDAVERALREERRERRERPFALVAAARRRAEAEHVDEDRPQQRAPVVVVPRDHARDVEGQGRELARPHEEAHLPLALAGGEAEVQVEHLEPPRAPGRRAHGDARVLTAAPLQEPDREVDVPLALDRPAAQSGVAVAALAQRDVVADRPVLVAEGARQLAAEVHLARPRRAVVHLLQHRHVGVVVPDDRSDALRQEAPVDADRAVDVVAEDAQSHAGRPE